MKKLTITKTTDLKIRNSLIRWYESSTENQRLRGINWYFDAQRFVRLTAEEFKLDSYKVACVVSALSPNNKWERNMQDAITVIKAHRDKVSPKKVKVCTYDANKLKAFGILSGSVELKDVSPKTHSFAMNMALLSDTHVTIDKWHIRACLCHPSKGVTNCVESVTRAQYQRIEAITARIAQEYRVSAYQFQAIVWLTIKENWGR